MMATVSAIAIAGSLGYIVGGEDGTVQWRNLHRLITDRDLSDATCVPVVGLRRCEGEQRFCGCSVQAP